MSINEQTFASERETILMQKSAAEQFATNSYFYSTSIESINAIVTNTSVALGTDIIPVIFHKTIQLLFPNQRHPLSNHWGS